MFLSKKRTLFLKLIQKLNTDLVVEVTETEKFVQMVALPYLENATVFWLRVFLSHIVVFFFYNFFSLIVIVFSFNHCCFFSCLGKTRIVERLYDGESLSAIFVSQFSSTSLFLSLDNNFIHLNRFIEMVTVLVTVGTPVTVVILITIVILVKLICCQGGNRQTATCSCCRLNYTVVFNSRIFEMRLLNAADCNRT